MRCKSFVSTALICPRYDAALRKSQKWAGINQARKWFPNAKQVQDTGYLSPAHGSLSGELQMSLMAVKDIQYLLIGSEINRNQSQRSTTYIGIIAEKETPIVKVCN